MRFPGHINDDNAKSQALQVLLKFEAPVNGDENVKMALRLRHQLGIRQSTPIGFSDSQYRVFGKGFPDSGIDAFI